MNKFLVLAVIVLAGCAERGIRIQSATERNMTVAATIDSSSQQRADMAAQNHCSSKGMSARRSIDTPLSANISRITYDCVP